MIVVRWLIDSSRRLSYIISIDRRKDSLFRDLPLYGKLVPKLQEVRTATIEIGYKGYGRIPHT